MNPVDVLTEFNHLLDKYEVKEDEHRQCLVEIVQNMADKSHWDALEKEPLMSLLFQGISLYGQTNWEPLVSVILPVYMHGIETVPVEDRRELQSAIREKIEANEASVNAFLPFLILETDTGIVSTTVIDFAMIPKPPEDDPIGWPRRLISDFEAGMGANKGAMLGGLITLGDHRVNELLSEIKWLLSDHEIAAASNCVSGMPTVAAFEFWLNWTEDLATAGLDDTGLFGNVASGLSSLLTRMQVDYFADITRNFGYLHSENHDIGSMVVHGQYMKPEVAKRFADRLYALEAAEPPPKVLSEVIRNLGLEPKAPLEERFTMQ